MRNLFKILKSVPELRKYYWAVSLMSLGLSAMSILVPVLSGRAIDELRKGEASSLKYLVTIALIIFALDLSQTIFSNINGHIGDMLAVRLKKILSSRYYEHLLVLPQSYFDNELSGKIINRLQRSIVQIVNFVQMYSNSFLQFVVTTVLSLAAVAWYSVPVAVLLFMLYPIFIIMTVKSSGKWQEYQGEINTLSDEATGRFVESIGQVKVVKSYSAEARELKYFGRRFNKIIDLTRPQSIYWHQQDVKRRLILNAIFFGVYVVIFVQAGTQSISPGQAVALMLHAMNIRIPIFTISWLVENTQRAVADSKDYFEVMDLPADKESASSRDELKVTKGVVKFDKVSFSYSKDKAMLENLDFILDGGSRTALVGESGEGKTTISNLMLRFYKSQSGTITIDGQRLDDVSLKSLRKNISVVFQEASLFSGTIRENIAYARPTATDEQVQAAAKAANAHEFITALEKGYESEIGERGLKLSGGQKQRIAIARAILKNAPILILDEATSSLDNKSEKVVQEALDRLMQGRTTLIIAHRLTTIASVDKIITIKKGKIDEIGSPSVLAKSGGIYSELLALQSGDTRYKKKLAKYELVSNS
jgi:ATP-binding cassette, subfamily B, bacterial